MKIDEPKTPYAKRYEPTEEEEAEMRILDAEDLKVDELDKVKAAKSGGMRERDIPGLELGEPEEPFSLDGGSSGVIDGNLSRSGSVKGEKQVVVDRVRDGGHHGEENVGLSAEEREKHRKFEERRKQHYEMKDVKDLLGYVFRLASQPRGTLLSYTDHHHPSHPEELDALSSDDDDDESRAINPIPNGRQT